MGVTSEDRDMAALKLTVTPEGEVWYLDGSKMPRSTGCDISSFLASPIINSHPEIIRIPGIASNAGILKELYQLKLKEAIAGLEVCTPLCCDTEERKDPMLLLFSMRKFHAPVALGGWHEFTMKDYTTYALIAHYQANGDESPYVERLLEAHPVWPYLSFIDGICKEACRHLLATIVDPRWYFEPYGETSDDRLEHYLGVVSGALSKTDSSARQQRYNLVLRCWKGNAIDSKALLSGGPSQFLWRTWAVKGGNARGDVAASRKFVSFLRQLWLAALCQGAQSAHLFVPKFFFDNQDEVDTFSKHLQQNPI